MAQHVKHGNRSSDSQSSLSRVKTRTHNRIPNSCFVRKPRVTRATATELVTTGAVLLRSTKGNKLTCTPQGHMYNRRPCGNNKCGIRNMSMNGCNQKKKAHPQTVLVTTGAGQTGTQKGEFKIAGSWTFPNQPRDDQTSSCLYAAIIHRDASTASDRRCCVSASRAETCVLHEITMIQPEKNRGGHHNKN